MLDVTRVRSHFPSLLRRHGDVPAVHFDNPAGTQVPQPAIDGYGRYFERHNADVAGSFSTSVETEEIIGQARAGMAEFLHATAPNSAVFGPIDVQALDRDFLMCSAYRLFGPDLGPLYGRDELLAAIPPYKVRPAADDAPGK